MTALDDAQALLMAERQALLDGRFDDLAGIAARLSEILPRLTDKADDLAALRETAAGNQRLLAAALAGFRAGQRRIADVFACRAEHGGRLGYDARGRQLAAPSNRRLEHRS